MNVQEWGVDALTLSAHKFHGPKGVGFMYLRKNIRIQPLIHGGAQERGKRAGTINVPGIVGMGKAAELAGQNMEERIKYETELRDYLIQKIKDTIPYLKLNGDEKKRLPNNVNFSFRFVEGESLLLMLDKLKCFLYQL